MSDLSQRIANLSPAKRSLLARRLVPPLPKPETPIAIVGMGCRFPGAADLEAYWQLIAAGKDATGPIPASRWNVDELYDPTGTQPGKMSTRWGGFVDQVDQFDAPFFGITPREASRMDPQQRLLLEVAWEALEHAGIPASRLSGTATGVYVGIGGTDYSKLPAQFEDYYQHIDAHVGTGNALSIAANRLSYVLDLRGPSLAIDTACSSSSMAIHLATAALRGRQCDAALAGGVNLILSPETTIAFSKAQMLSPDGRCRPFDAGANGYVRGEGCGIVVLKRLDDALAAGDAILAVIRATAANQDGRTSGITAPNGIAQQAVIRAALQRGGIEPHQVGYIEAHGTGTPLGDPIEVQALTEVFRRQRPDEPPCYVTSVKANIGHTETVSGVAGVIKVALLLQHEQIAPQLYFQSLNPHMDLSGSRVVIPREAVAWSANARPRYAGISSFGFGGTNTHLLIEGADSAIEAARGGADEAITAASTRSPTSQQPTSPPPTVQPAAARRPRILALSAKSDAALRQLADVYSRHLAARPELDWTDVCAAANTGRSHFTHRLAAVAADRGALENQLRRFAEGQPAPGLVHGQVKISGRPRIAFLFTGQGSQYVQMGRQLDATEPVFRRALDRCEEVLREHAGWSLRSVLYPQDGAPVLLNETAYTQPALFALEYALAEMWRAWGVMPEVVMGHSVGEYVAACVAGVFSVEEGLRLIAERGRLMQQLPRNGKMVVVFTSAERVAAAIEPYADKVAIAAINGPENTVLSGAAAVVDALVERFAAAGTPVQSLPVSHAFHSPLMEPMLAQFERFAEAIRYRAPQTPLISNLTGQISRTAPTAASWCQHLRQPVRFAEAVATLAQMKPHALLELGPTASLLGMARRCSADLPSTGVASLRAGRSDGSVVADALARLYALGVDIRWEAFEGGRPHVPLPTYPFQRSRHWFDPQGAAPRHFDGGRGPTLHPLLGSVVPTAWNHRLFELRLAANAPSYLQDHQVQGSVVVPAAAYVEQALAAAEQLFGSGRHVVEELSIQQAMFLAPGEPRAVQIAVAPESGGRSVVQVFSRPSSETDPAAPWTLHAQGSVRPGGEDDTGRAQLEQQLDRQQFADAVVDSRDHAGFYQLLAARGLQYGPQFRVIDQVRRTPCEAVATLRWPPEVTRQADSYRLHPVLGDACLQTIACTVPLETDGGYSPSTYLPVAVGQVQVIGDVAEARSVWAVRRSADDSPSPEMVEADVCLLDADDRVVARLDAVRIQKLPGRSAAEKRDRAGRDWLYQVGWQEEPLAGTPEHDAAAWLLMADDATATHIPSVATELASAVGGRLLIVRPGEEFFQDAEEQPTAFTIRPDSADDYARLLQAAGAAGPLAGVIHLWNLDLGAGIPESEEAIEDLYRLGSGSLLRLVQQLARHGEAPPLWIVTRGAQAVEAGAPVSAAQTAAWGLGRVAAVEHPELRVRLVDLDPASDAAQNARHLASELTSDLTSRSSSARADRSTEDQIAYRRGRRLVARLRRAGHLLSERSDEPARRLPASGPFQLRIGARGGIDSLRYLAAPRSVPGEGQVEIEVRAAGLNFSDVLKAMGLYPGIRDAVVPVGIEASGIVTAVGAGCDGLSVGDEVMGVVPYAFASHATSAQYALVPKPMNLSHQEACTLPIAFLTAYHALVHVAQLQPGERVLIHAGAGGVGLAAIQVAQHGGAEVFATAGSEQKRAFLRELGVQHVYNSRTLDFAEEVMADTAREGIDVVLNSLPGDAIAKSLGLLRAYGRFVEIGKTDIYQNRMLGLLPFQDNLTYSAVDLDRMLRQRPQLIRRHLQQLMEHFHAGDYQPLPLTQFAAAETVDAFRYMAQRRNIGKVVVSLEDRPSESAAALHRDASPGDEAAVRGTHLITGGGGALGLGLARHLGRARATHLVLLGRRPPQGATAEAIDALAATGVRIHFAVGDVTDAASLQAALDAIPRDFPPLRGVYHAAGALADGLLMEMSEPQLRRAMAAKVEGAWNLHRATRTAPLDSFVCFSSVASILGSPGQGNYAAGNAFLDGLAAARRAAGLPALSINWGPWDEGGMAADKALADQLRRRGMELLPAEAAWHLLDRLLALPEAIQATVLDARWDAVGRLKGSRRGGLLDEVLPGAQEDAAASPHGDGHPLRDELLACPPDERQERLLEHLRQELSNIMGIAADQWEVDQPLQSLGLDSLMAIELKTKLESQLAIHLPMAALIDQPSAASLSAVAADQLFEAHGEETTAPDDSAAESGGVPVTAPAWSPLRSLRAARSDSPARPAADSDAALWLVHPLGGDLRCYGALTEHLPRDLAILGLEARGLDGRLPPHASIEALAAEHVQAMLARQPAGPFRLAGWSAGGVFAFEISRQLLMAGREVDRLFLIDTPLPSIYDSLDLEDDARFLCDLVEFTNRFAGSQMAVSYDQLRQLPPSEALEVALAEAKKHGVVPAQASTALMRARIEVARSAAQSIRRYRPQPLPLRPLLIRPMTRGTLEQLGGRPLPEDLGWESQLGQPVRLISSPGDHFTMLSAEHAGELAERVAAQLALGRVDAGTSAEPAVHSSSASPWSNEPNGL